MRGNMRGRFNSGNSRRPPSCALCTQAGRHQANHYLSSCPYLPEENKRFMNRARLVEFLELENEEFYPPYSNLQSDLGNNLPQDNSNNYDNNYQYQPPGGENYNDNNQGKVSSASIS